MSLSKESDVSLNTEGIPIELRELPRWVAWRWKPGAKPGGKRGKEPVNGRTGGNASSTNPETWTSFEHAVAHARAHKLPGVGFMLEGSGYTGFDWDHCRDSESGTIDAGALADLELFQTYSEISPSGTGLRAIAKGNLPPGRRKGDHVEMYDSGRFLTFTGARLEGFPATVEERADEIALLHARHFPAKPAQHARRSRTSQPHTEPDQSDDALIERARSAANGELFAALMAGDWDGRYSSQSSADLALVSLIAFWTGPEPERIDSIFRRSGLMRDKWTSPRGASTYGRITIEMALAGKTDYHDGGKRTRSTPATATQAPATYHLTDTGNSERLAERFGSNLRYCFPWKSWVVYDGKRWKRDDAGVAIARTKQVARSLLVEASRCDDTYARDQILKHAKASEKAERRKAMVELARSEPGIAISPDVFDRHPFLLNCPNGTLDLETFTLRPHSRDDFLTKLCPTKYVPGAPCPNWLRTIERVLPDDETRSYFQRFGGYALTGDVSEQALLVGDGRGKNGKSTILCAAIDVLGEGYAIQISTELLLAKDRQNHPTELADLFGVRLAVGTETPKGRSFDERLMKVLTGGEPIRARRMHENFWQFEPTHKLALITNHMPKVSHDDFAATRRLHVVHFEVTIPKEELDKKLPAKLRKEREGILAWLVEGCRQWQAVGLNPPEEVLFRPQVVARTKLPVEEFCELFVRRVPGTRTGASTLYEAFLAWCARTNRPRLTQTDFGTHLGTIGFGRKKSNGTMTYLELAFVAEDGKGDGRGEWGPTSPSFSTRAPHEKNNGESGPHHPRPSPEDVDAETGGSHA